MERRYESYLNHVVKPFFRDHFARLDRRRQLGNVRRIQLERHAFQRPRRGALKIHTVNIESRSMTGALELLFFFNVDSGAVVLHRTD